MTEKKARTNLSSKTALQRQARFIEEFIRGGNMGNAALAAGWGKGNRDHACQHVSTLLAKDAAFREALAKRQAEVASAMKLETEHVLAQVAACVHSDIRKVFREDGSLKAVHELDDVTAKAISSIKVETVMRGGSEDRVPVQVAEVKFWSKVEMVEKAMKHLGLFERDNRQRATPLEELITYVQSNGRGLPIADQCSPARTTLPTTPTHAGG